MSTRSSILPAARRPRRAAPVAAALAFALASGVAAAQDLPPERPAGIASYVTGGVSEEESNAFKAARAGYPLSVELVQRQADRNAFTADARVRLTDRSGNVVLDAKAEGPFMLVRVPPGEYRVQATLNGRTVEGKPVTVGSQGGARAVLVFPAGTD